MTDEIGERADETALLKSSGLNWARGVERNNVIRCIRAQAASTREEVEKEIAEWLDQLATVAENAEDADDNRYLAEAIRSGSYRHPPAGESNV